MVDLALTRARTVRLLSVATIATLVTGLAQLPANADGSWTYHRTGEASTSYQSSSTNWISWGENADLYSYTEWDDRWLDTGEPFYVYNYLENRDTDPLQYTTYVSWNPDFYDWTGSASASSCQSGLNPNWDIVAQDDGDYAVGLEYGTWANPGDCLNGWITFEWDSSSGTALFVDEISDPPGSSGDDILWGSSVTALATRVMEVAETNEGIRVNY